MSSRLKMNPPFHNQSYHAESDMPKTAVALDIKRFDFDKILNDLNDSDFSSSCFLSYGIKGVKYETIFKNITREDFRDTLAKTLKERLKFAIAEILWRIKRYDLLQFEMGICQHQAKIYFTQGEKYINDWFCLLFEVCEAITKEDLANLPSKDGVIYQYQEEYVSHIMVKYCKSRENKKEICEALICTLKRINAEDEDIKAVVQKMTDCINIYPMGGPGEKCGTCYVFNIENYDTPEDPKDTNFPDRRGSAKDADALKKTFEKLHFRVEIIPDPTLKTVQAEIDKIQKTFVGHCLIICILAHGIIKDGELNIATSDGRYITREEIVKKFEGERFEGIPKLFLLQVCRKIKQEEAEVEAGISSDRVFTDGEVETDGNQGHKRKDMLIWYSTYFGDVSYRVPGFGSVFIQTLCWVINSKEGNIDLNDVKTEVTRKIIECSITSAGEKQMPCTESDTLCKKLIFRRT